MVSVIIPVYNVEKYIARCLDSVLKQTYRDLEIIVVNDATPDNSMAIVEDYAAKDSRIRIIHNHRNMGLMMTRKNGYSTAKGDHLIFADSDDYLPNNAVELLIENATQTNADIVAGTIHYIKNDGETENWTCKLPFGHDRVNVYKALLSNQFTHNLCAKLFKTSLLQEFKYKSYTHMTNAEDACLFYQLVENTKRIETIPNNVYNYMENTASSTHGQFSIQQIRNIILANKTRIDICTKYPELARLADQFVTNVLCRLNLYGYSRKQIRKMLQEYGMEHYGSIYHAMSVLPFRNILSIVKNNLLLFGR